MNNQAPQNGNAPEGNVRGAIKEKHFDSLEKIPQSTENIYRPHAGKLDNVLSRLYGVKHQANGSYTARCPSHDDKTASLSITEKDGKILLYCHAGCETGAILQAVALKMSDLFSGSHRSKPAARKTIRVYSYSDLAGNVRHETLRFEPKGFISDGPTAPAAIIGI